MANINTSQKQYMVTDEMSDYFANIARFAYNMILKDSEDIEAHETEMSKFMGDMLLKYFNTELTIDDVANLLTFVYNYNTKLYSIYPEKIKVEDPEDPESKIEISNPDYPEYLKNRIMYGYYHFGTGNSKRPTKLKASEYEKTMATEGNSAVFFDIGIDNNMINAIFSSNSDLDRLFSETIDRNTGFLSIQILYKEFNETCRKILHANLFETIVSIKDHDILLAIKPDAESSEKRLSAALNFAKTQDTSHYITSDNADKNYDIIQYLYTSPYTIRDANESDIIAYYYGDNIVSNGYGKYIYQKREIENFIYTYTQCRDYFHKVLLNEAFIHEIDYRLYERFYIITFAILRSISNKTDNFFDIDSYTQQDLLNFFESFGFKELATKFRLRENGVFSMTLEETAKKIAKSYTVLMANKGSNQIIDILKEIFSQALTVTEVKLVERITDGGKTFTAVPITTNESSLDTIVNSIDSIGIDLDAFGKTDKYFSTYNSGSEVLQDYDVNVTNTKWAQAKYTMANGAEFAYLQCVLAVLTAFEKNSEWVSDIQGYFKQYYGEELYDSYFQYNTYTCKVNKDTNSNIDKTNVLLNRYYNDPTEKNPRYMTAIRIAKIHFYLKDKIAYGNYMTLLERAAENQDILTIEEMKTVEEAFNDIFTLNSKTEESQETEGENDGE